MGKRLKKAFFKKDIQIANKHIEKILASLATWKIKTKTTTMN